jgi:iron complex outermembrane receptor protein
MPTQRLHLHPLMMACLCTLAVPTATSAQSAQPATAAAAGGAERAEKTENAADDNPQTIVVSAQKRIERLKDVPQAVSAYSGKELAAQGLTSATDLPRVSPSLTFSDSANTRGEGFRMRGVGTSVFADTIEQSVGFMVDGVTMARSGQGSGGLIDVDRVEILRGPQGMLFGKNASAGLVSVVTRKPRLGVTSGEATLSFSPKFDETKTELIANAPLGESAAVRVAYASATADGFVTNVLDGRKLNDTDEQVVRAKALFNLSDNLELLVIADGSRSRSDCCAWTARSAPAGTTFAALNAANGIVPSQTNLQIAANAGFWQRSTQGGLSAEVNYDVAGLTLTSLTAAREWRSSDNNDPDLLPLNVLDINSGRSELRQVSQELRLTSPSGGAVEWVAGLYLHDQRNRSVQEQTGNFGGLFTPFGVPAGANVGVLQNTTTDNEGQALFGQVGWRLKDWKFTAGARYTTEKVKLRYASSPSTAIPRPGYSYGATVGDTSADNLSWRLTAQTDLTKDDMAYVTAARGYKGPGLEFLDNGNGPVSVVRPEIPTTVEAGLRTFWPSVSTVLNVALFKSRFDQFQAQVFDQTITPSKFRTLNAGRLDTEGVEVEVNARPLAGLTLTGSLAYVDARYGEFRNIPCYAGQPILPFGTVRTSPRECIRTGAAANATAVTEGTGLPLPGAPRLTYHLGLRQEFGLPAGFKGAAQINHTWRDKVSYSSAGDPLLVQAAYGLTDAAFELSPQGARWTVTLFGRNLGNEHHVQSVIAQPTLGGAGVSSQFPTRAAYRTFGLRLRVQLGD